MLDTALQAIEAPRLLVKKHLCLWLQGLLAESHFHLLGRWLSKGGRPNPMLKQNISSEAQRGSSEEGETTVKSNLSQALILEPGGSLVWVPL